MKRVFQLNYQQKITKTMAKKERLNEGHVKTNVKPPAKTPRPSIKPAPQKPKK